MIAVPTGIVMLLFFYACQCDNAYYDIEQSVLFAGRVCLSRRVATGSLNPQHCTGCAYLDPSC